MKRVVSFLFAVMVAASTAAADTDALPSWNDGPAKSAIIAFVQSATDTSSMKFVPPPQRIAVFDNDGTPVLVRLPQINFIDNKAGKPVGINQHIGRRPIAAFGNSDGDIEMLQYTDSGKDAHLEMMVHHDDARREYAYTCDTKIGRLCKGLELARERGWQIISMKNDWKAIFPKK